MDEISAVRSGVASCQQVKNARKRMENSDCVCDLQVVSKLNKNLRRYKNDIIARRCRSALPDWIL